MSKRIFVPMGVTAAACLAHATVLVAQSSSLYVTDPQQPAYYAGPPRPAPVQPAGALPPAPAPMRTPAVVPQPMYASPGEPPLPPRRPNDPYLNPYVVAGSITAIVPPEPRRFAQHDLLTIIIREQSSASTEATLETEKDFDISGEVKAFPHLNLADLIRFERLKASRRGEEDPFPEWDVSFSNEFDGEGEYERRDSLTTRLGAQIVDVKPNGTLTIEARTHIENDEEQLTITVTGTCRSEDVSADNTILSTQIFDLRIVKAHEGEMRKTTKKGLFSRVLETIFNF